MSGLTPALVTQSSARRLPRLPLLLLCAAYVLPGLFGRDPWRNADVAAFGQMVAMAEGRTSWWLPTLGGVSADTALLPHWLGAAFIKALSPLLDPALAARLPFALLLGLTLALVWYTTFHLARTEAAQPVAFAFGGEADPVNYARAIADGALLALMACLGLLLLGHETTPELAQLFAISLYGYALAAAPFRRVQSISAALLALPLLAGSGAPGMALAAGLGGMLVFGFSRRAEVRSLLVWLVVATLAAATLGWFLGEWRWRTERLAWADLPALARQWLWFMWPAWPLALWTLWQWRRHLSNRHISVPLVSVLVALATSLAMGGWDRALMLALPGLAVLAAFALPTLKRRASAAVDWFSMIFFTLCAVYFWLLYIAMHTGVPAKPASSVARIVPGFVPQFSMLELAAATLGSLAWIALVRWRTGRHRDALWKSLVLPAGGVALCWLLFMSLLLQPVDYARSPRAFVSRLAVHVPADACIWAPGLSRAGIAALEHFGRWPVDARLDDDTQGARPPCAFQLRVSRSRVAPPEPAGWAFVADVRRPTERDEATLVYRRIGSR
jgi:4-amino-4-deoxy-L-arabinose transferase-like glycosyltransferase